MTDGANRKIGIPESPWLTLEEAARYLRFVSVKAFYTWSRRHGVPRGRRGRALLFEVRVLDAFVRQDAWTKRHRAEPIVPNLDPLPEGPVLSTGEARQILGFDEVWMFQQFLSQNNVPFIQRGRQRFYEKSTVDQLAAAAARHREWHEKRRKERPGSRRGPARRALR